MRRALLLACLGLAPAALPAADSGDLPGYAVQVDLSNRAALQRGARYFVNYCLGCHALAHSRYRRVGEDLGLTDRLVRENLVFTDQRIGENMTVAMDAGDAERWFGAAPPDLSVLARQKGADYIYEFLMTFYRDDKRPWGVNNWRFPNTAMPHVLWREQGLQEAETRLVDGHATVVGLAPGVPGRRSPEQYREMVTDLTTFLVYVSEPVRLTRESAGVWVLGFLLLLIGLTYFLKREYWRDVH